MKAREGEHPRGDVGQVLLLVLFLAVWTADSFFWHGTTSLATHVPLALRLVLLVLAVTVAAILVRSGHVVVDQGDRGLLTDGAFRHVRHPLYLGSVLGCLGLALATASFAALAATAGIFAFYDHIASYEERWLSARYGEAYRTYRSRTGKWWPRG